MVINSQKQEHFGRRHAKTATMLIHRIVGHILVYICPVQVPALCANCSLFSDEFRRTVMIDVETWRRRIGGAPGVLSQVLGRKARARKDREAATPPHGEEDLLRKFLKRQNLRCSSYLQTWLVTAFVLLLSVNKTILILGGHVFGYVQNIGSSLQLQNALQTGDVLLEGSAALACAGLCLSQLGAVHFISMLLLMAGIEPNPGPDPVPDPSTSTSTSEVHSSQGSAVPGPTPVQPFQSAASSITPEFHGPNLSSLTRTCLAKLQSATTKGNDDVSGEDSDSGHSRPSDGFPSVFAAQNGFWTSSPNASRGSPSLGSVEELDESTSTLTRTVSDLRAVLTNNRLDLRERNLEADGFEKLVSLLDSVSEQIDEVDLTFSTFCSESWHTHPDGLRNLKRLFTRPKLKYLKKVSLDVATIAAEVESPPYPLLQTRILPHPQPRAEPRPRPNPQVGGVSLSLRFKTLHPAELRMLRELLRCLVSSESMFEVTSLDLHKSTVQGEGQTWEQQDARGRQSLLDQLLQVPELQSVSLLDLSHMSLTSVPSSLGTTHHHRLKELSLRYNRLESIPSSIAACKFLTHLDLSWNWLTTLPDVLDLPNLETLNLEENPMFEIPSVVGHLPKLQRLIIGSPQTRAVHRDILQRVLKGNPLRLVIEVRQHQKTLRAPTYEELTTSLQKYVRDLKQRALKMQGMQVSSL